MLGSPIQEVKDAISLRLIKILEKHPFHCILNNQIYQNFLVYTDKYKEKYKLDEKTLFSILFQLLKAGELEIYVLNNITREWALHKLNQKTIPIETGMSKWECCMDLPYGQYYVWDFNEIHTSFNFTHYADVEQSPFLINSKHIRNSNPNMLTKLVQDLQKIMLIKDPFARKLLWTLPDFEEKIKEILY